ncbi:hypothetical protein KFE25_008517 [Diacronema lutheri]|uniref:peptidylprolyl isomerase n=1 Tax=Diacronema lutheri TaxID=2081491 RepID=A0A8J5XJ58_DIALT|nr:hypothetical protein KFE25_008517 [Diacronema lutheri]
MEVLLPRDFCDKQPKRWKKDASRRGATRAISKIEKSHAQRVAGKLRELAGDPRLERDRVARVRKASDRAAADSAARAAVDAEDAVERALVTSTSMPFAADPSRGDRFWACELREGSALVVRLPADAVLTLTAAVLVEAAEGAAAGAVYALRCRTPAYREPACLCALSRAAAGAPNELEQHSLNVDFTADGDGKLALALEPVNAPALAAAVAHAERAAPEGDADERVGTAPARERAPLRARAHVHGIVRRGARPVARAQQRSEAPPGALVPAAGEARGARATHAAAALAERTRATEATRTERAARVPLAEPANAAADGGVAHLKRPRQAAGADGSGMPTERVAPPDGAAKETPKLKASRLKLAPAREQTEGGATVVELGDGLKVVDNKLGQAHGGRRVATGDKLTVRFQGLVHGPPVGAKRARGGDDEDSWKEFERGTLSFTLGAGDVIKGWDRGIVGMRVGGRRTLIVPAHLAYGSRGAPPKGNGGGVGIPPYATLVFRLELLNAQ